MAILTKGIRGILTLTKKTLLTKKGYEGFLSSLSKKNGVRYILISEKQKQAIMKITDFVNTGEVPYDIERFFYKAGTSEFDKEMAEQTLLDTLARGTNKVKEEIEELLELKDKGKITDKELKKELIKLKDNISNQKDKYVLKIEELQRTQDNRVWNEHASSKTIFGTPRSAWNLGCSYNTKKRLMLFVGKQGDTIDQWLIEGVSYAKWIVIRDYQGFVPNNGIGTFTIRNIKKKRNWKKI